MGLAVGQHSPEGWHGRAGSLLPHVVHFIPRPSKQGHAQHEGGRIWFLRGSLEVILLGKAERLFKCLLNDCSSLLIFSRPVIWSLFYSGAASPASDRLGNVLYVVRSQLRWPLCRKPTTWASNASSDLYETSRLFSLFGVVTSFPSPFHDSQLIFWLEKKLWEYCVHYTLVHRRTGT